MHFVRRRFQKLDRFPIANKRQQPEVRSGRRSLDGKKNHLSVWRPVGVYKSARLDLSHTHPLVGQRQLFASATCRAPPIKLVDCSRSIASEHKLRAIRRPFLRTRRKHHRKFCAALEDFDPFRDFGESVSRRFDQRFLEDFRRSDCAGVAYSL
jgi:hypothetical protein